MIVIDVVIYYSGIEIKSCDYNLIKELIPETTTIRVNQERTFYMLQDDTKNLFNLLHDITANFDYVRLY